MLQTQAMSRSQPYQDKHANSSGMPTEFAAGHNKDDVVEGKFRNLKLFAFHQKGS